MKLGVVLLALATITSLPWVPTAGAICESFDQATFAETNGVYIRPST